MVRRLACVVLLVSATARAQSVRIAPVGAAPGEKAALVVTPDADASALRADLMHDGRVFSVEHGPASAGEAVRLTVPSPGKYTGKLHVTFAGRPMVWNVDFTIPAAAPPAAGDMKIGYDREHLDLDAHTLEFTLSRRAAHAELTVNGDDGTVVATASAGYHGERPGTWLSIHWTPTHAANVLTLVLVATSTDGARTRLTLTPWSVTVPHEEVVFETGKSDIRPSEDAKLDASYKKIIGILEKARKADPNMRARLYIAGHTDTVGSAADNRKLSLERARAIAGWFHDRGLPLTIAYAGFGEDAPRVRTPDNTDEPRNRRVDYVVAVEPPMIARGVHATWYQLK